MLSRTGYTRRHSRHLRLSPLSLSLSLSTSGFLQTGQTSISSNSWEIMRDILRQWGPLEVTRTIHHRDTLRLRSGQSPAQRKRIQKAVSPGCLCLCDSVVKQFSDTSLTSLGRRTYISFCFRIRFARPPHSRRIGKRVQIPRCRATVSEDVAPGHWSLLWEGPRQYRTSWK